MPSHPTGLRKRLAILTPAGVAAGPWRTLGFWPSFCVHLVGLALFAIGLLALYPDNNLSISFVSLAELAMFCLGLLMIFLFIQLGVLCLSLATMCWGAGVERWSVSLGRTASRWYQTTPWLAVLLIGFIATMDGIDTLQMAYYDYSHSSGPPGVYIALEQDRFWFLIQFLRSAAVCIFFPLGLWMTLATLAVHREKPRWHASCRWPAVCAGCGYALVGLTDEMGCPECGMPVAQSKQSRRGPIKTPATHLLWSAMIRPTNIGEQMLTRRHTDKPLRVFLLALLAVVITGPIGMVVIDLAESIGWGSFPEQGLDFIELYIVMGTMVGVLIAVAGAFIAMGVGSVNATSARAFGKRNAMVASCKAACLGAGVLPLWSLLNFFLIAIMVASEYLFDSFYYGPWDLAIPLTFLAFHIGMLVLYMVLVGRIERAARFANE